MGKHAESGDHRAIREQRDGIHGPHVPGYRALGMTWAALLSDWLGLPVPALPPHIVNLLFVAAKVQRAAKPMTYEEDDYDDARNYLDFAQEADPLNPESELHTDLELQELRAELQAIYAARNELARLTKAGLFPGDEPKEADDEVE